MALITAQQWNYLIYCTVKMAEFGEQRTFPQNFSVYSRVTV